jgi:CheY-like chemotaxis protein
MIARKPCDFEGMSATELNGFLHQGVDGRPGPIWSVAPPLVLDRNVFMRGILTNLLRDAGAANVVATATAEAAENALKDRHPSVLISDWSADSKPEEDRLRLVRRIRESEFAPYRDIPVVFVSPPRTRREVERARDAGVNEFLVTPIAPITLQQRLRSLDARPRNFIGSPRFVGPDRRRRNLRETGRSLKRTADVESGLTTPMSAARAAAVALAHETRLTGDQLSIRVGRSLQRFLSWAADYTPVEAEVVDMHRATLAQLSDMAANGDALREPVVFGLEQVVAKRMGHG